MFDTKYRELFKEHAAKTGDVYGAYCYVSEQYAADQGMTVREARHQLRELLLSGRRPSEVVIPKP